MEMTAEKTQKFNYFFGLINLVAVFCIVWFLWYVLLHPMGILKLYTPMYGFALVVTWVCAIVLMVNIAEYYPFRQDRLEEMNVITKGVILTVIAFVLMLFIFYCVFWGFIGKFGITYFSPGAIVKTGGLGAEPFLARERSCVAIVYYLTAFLWIAFFWIAGFGNWPWHKDASGVRVWSRFFAVSFFATIAYTVLLHPHVCYLFYPPQTMAGVEPWWSSIAQTGSAFFFLGIIVCTMFIIIISDLLWEGYPWKLLEKDGEGTFLKGVVTFFGTLVLGIILMVILLKIMNIPWDEAYQGGQFTDGTDFRYLHAAEIAGFFLLAAFILKSYFNNFPNVKGIWPRAIIRTVIALAGGGLIHLFYYSPATEFFLGKVPGVGSPEDVGLVWTFFFLSVIMVQNDFFDGWPLQRKGVSYNTHGG